MKLELLLWRINCSTSEARVLCLRWKINGSSFSEISSRLKSNEFESPAAWALSYAEEHYEVASNGVRKPEMVSLLKYQAHSARRKLNKVKAP